jgi:hypothetical protein
VKVYSYIVTHDSGFSPNPFQGTCTLACCKPQIRRSAKVGDLVIGLATLGRRFVYAMKVSEVLHFADYWNVRDHAGKRPYKSSSLVIDRRGDNIYQPIANGEFRQLPSSHSHPDGTEDLGKKYTDLGGERVLLEQLRVLRRGWPTGSRRSPLLGSRPGSSLPLHDRRGGQSRGMVRSPPKGRARSARDVAGE